MEFENKKLRSVAEAAARIMMGEKALHPNQQKLDVHEPEKDKLTAQDFKKLRTMKKEETMHEESCECGSCPSDKDMKKEEVELEEMDKEGYTATRDGDDYTKGKQITVKPKSVMSSKSATSSAFRQLNKAFNKDSEKKDMKKEEVELDEGKMGQLDADLKDLSHDEFTKEYGKPKHHYDPSNFKKPVQKGQEMNRAKALAQRAMASMKKEEVEQIEEMFPGSPEYEKKYGKAPQDMKKGEKKKTTQGEMEKTGKGVVHRRKFSEMVESYTEGGVKGLFKTLAEEPTSAEFDAQLADAKQRAAGTKKQPEVSKPAVQAVQNEEIELTLEDFTPEELEDFMQTEEYEQLDELSKETLGSYVKKSVKDVNTKSRHAQHYKSMFADQFPVRGAKKEVANKQEKINKRVTGIGKAVDRMTKEEIEEQTHTTVSFIDYNDVNGVKYAEIDLSKKD